MEEWGHVTTAREVVKGEDTPVERCSTTVEETGERVRIQRQVIVVSLLVLRSKVEVRTMYYRDKKEDMREGKDCNITPFVHSSPRLDIPKSFIHYPQGY